MLVCQAEGFEHDPVGERKPNAVSNRAVTQLDVCSRRLSLAVAEMMVWGLRGASWETLEVWRAGRRQSPKSAVLSHVRLCATQCPGAHQAPLSAGSSKQEHWSGFPYPPPGDLPDPVIEPTSLCLLLW